MEYEHLLPTRLLERPVRVLIVGSGGNGSAILLGLPYLHQAMLVWGHPGGLDVTVMDGDAVSETNCIRQPFSLSDVGMNKATVLVNRVNMFWGLGWKACAQYFRAKSLEAHDGYSDIVIGCVDTKAARRTIAQAVTGTAAISYWLDLGNNAASGQYVFGQPKNRLNRHEKQRLHTVAELYPEIADSTPGEDPLPSCSAVEALEHQEPFINQTLAAGALAMLSRLFRYGRIGFHGAFFNAITGKMSVLKVSRADAALTKA